MVHFSFFCWHLSPKWIYLSITLQYITPHYVWTSRICWLCGIACLTITLQCITPHYMQNKTFLLYPRVPLNNGFLTVGKDPFWGPCLIFSAFVFFQKLNWKIAKQSCKNLKITPLMPPYPGYTQILAFTNWQQTKVICYWIIGYNLMKPSPGHNQAIPSL